MSKKQLLTLAVLVLLFAIPTAFWLGRGYMHEPPKTEPIEDIQRYEEQKKHLDSTIAAVDRRDDFLEYVRAVNRSRIMDSIRARAVRDSARRQSDHFTSNPASIPKLKENL